MVGVERVSERRVVRRIGSIPLDEENGDNGKALSVTGRWCIRSG